MSLLPFFTRQQIQHYILYLTIFLQDKEHIYNNLLQLAAKLGYKNTIIYLMQDRKSDINHITDIDGTLRTPILTAAAYGHYDIVRYLLSQGADPRDIDPLTSYFYDPVMGDSFYYNEQQPRLKNIFAHIQKTPLNLILLMFKDIQRYWPDLLEEAQEQILYHTNNIDVILYLIDEIHIRDYHELHDFLRPLVKRGISYNDLLYLIRLGVPYNNTFLRYLLHSSHALTMLQGLSSWRVTDITYLRNYSHTLSPYEHFPLTYYLFRYGFPIIIPPKELHYQTMTMLLLRT